MRDKLATVMREMFARVLREMFAYLMREMLANLMREMLLLLASAMQDNLELFKSKRGRGSLRVSRMSRMRARRSQLP